MENVLNVILTHQSPAEVDRLADFWKSTVDDANLLIAYGGPITSFPKIELENKIFIDDANLRTVDHQREGQSYTGIFRNVSQWLANNCKRADLVTLFEFDHLPLIADLNMRQMQRMRTEQADVLAYHLARVDGTSHAHYLYYTANAEFSRFVRELSVREDRDVVLSMFGTGSCWKREAFDAVAQFNEPFPIYFEVYLPTLAHHLGFRLRDYADQDLFVTNLGDRSGEIDRARERGAWTLHPVKNLKRLLFSALNS
ncbi:MAG TPA: hypothetical protein VFA58_09005 [Chthoniobacterales bacterium]|nr:hypothetical protein [Chthoniobacterales bacterium]